MFTFQSEDEALARALAESENLTNGNINSPQQRCSVSWYYGQSTRNSDIIAQKYIVICFVVRCLMFWILKFLLYIPIINSKYLKRIIFVNVYFYRIFIKLFQSLHIQHLVIYDLQKIWKGSLVQKVYPSSLVLAFFKNFFNIT